MSEGAQPGVAGSGNEHLPSAPTATLVILKGAAAEERYTIAGRAVLGRGVDCDIVLMDERVSRVHAEISLTTAGYVVRDLGSSNGTLLNDATVSEALLNPGDELLVGDVRLRFEVPSRPEARAAEQTVVLSAKAHTPHHVRVPGDAASLRPVLLAEDKGRAARAQAHLEALEQISRTLGRLRGLEDLYPLILEEILGVLEADRAALFSTDANGILTPEVVRNCREPGGAVEMSRTILDEVAEKRVCILSADATSEPQFDGSVSIVQQQVRSLLCVPMEYDGELLGAVYLDTSTRTGAFQEEDLRFVASVAAVAAVGVCNARALQEMRLAGQRENHAYLAMLEVLANAIEARDHYTIGHTWRVTRFAQVVAQQLGWDAAKVAEIEIGGVLHDIGKIGVPDAILRKPGPLGAEEYEQMKRHPEIGAHMLRGMPHLQHIIPYVRSHQERWDGHGYPDGLAGTDIPIEARVIAVADTLDAMTSSRPYRRAMEPEAAIEELRRQRGRQFDPDVIDAVLAAYETGQLQPYLQAGTRDGQDVLCPFCSTYFSPVETEVREGLAACPTCKRSLKLHMADARLYAELA